jgi:hypothetical protein
MEARPGIQNILFIRHDYDAHFRVQAPPRTPDMADFGPPFMSSDPMAHRQLPLGAPKPVCYLPVSRKAAIRWTAAR